MAETKRYRLPAQLGGGEVELFDRSPLRDGKWLTVVMRGGGPQFEIHENWLTALDPPVPDEPEPGAYLIGDVLCVRWPHGEDSEHHWWLGGSFHRALSWVEVWQNHGGPDVRIVALVPAEPCNICGAGRG